MEILQNFWNLMTTPNEDVIKIIAIPCLFVEGYVYMKLFTAVLDIKYTTKQSIIYIILFSLVGSVLQLTSNQTITSSINMVLLPVLVFFIFRAGLIKSILSEIIPVLFTVILEFLLINFSRIFSNISYEQLSLIPFYRILSVVIVYTSLFLLHKLFKSKKWILRVPNAVYNNKRFMLISNFLFGLILLGVQIYLTICYSDVLPILLIALNVITLIIYFSISFYNIYNTSKLATASANLEEAQLYNKTLSILHDNIRAFKHDFNNIVHAIGGYVQTNDMEGLKKYYSQLYSDCTKSNNLTALSPHVINNPAVYNIFATKYYIADDKGIDINLEVFFDLNQLNMKIYEFTRILRNING